MTRAFSTGAGDVVEKIQEKPSICTADELHYISVSNSDWRLPLWRYTPSPQVSHFPFSIDFSFSIESNS